MMKITGLSHLFKWENLHNWWLTKYFFAPLYIDAVTYVILIWTIGSKLSGSSLQVTHNPESIMLDFFVET